jgi:hypothetical protein
MVIFIFVIVLSISSMRRYEEVTLKRKGNKCGIVEISILATNGGIL